MLDTTTVFDDIVDLNTSRLVFILASGATNDIVHDLKLLTNTEPVIGKKCREWEPIGGNVYWEHQCPCIQGQHCNTPSILVSSWFT